MEDQNEQNSNPVSSLENIPVPLPRSHGQIVIIGALTLMIATFGGGTAFLYLKDRGKTDEIPFAQDIPLSSSSSAPTQAVEAEIKDPALMRIEPQEDVVCARFTSIENALEFPDQACILDLSGQGLTSVPREIYSLPNLTEVNLSNNKLTLFPGDLFGIQSLKVLDLSNNNISSIPSDAVLPDTLQLLSLSGNQLDQATMEKYKRTPDNAPAELAPEQDITK